MATIHKKDKTETFCISATFLKQKLQEMQGDRSKQTLGDFGTPYSDWEK